METYFAAPERLAVDPLRSELTQVTSHPVIRTLLSHVGGVLAVLNRHRQVLAVNHGFLNDLGIASDCGFLGLRLGEILECEHAHEMEGGCGTSRACSSCGAAIAMVAALQGEETREQTCTINTRRHGFSEDLYLRVRASAIEIDGHRLILIFLQDMTFQQKWCMLERVFFHDINNLVAGITSVAELLSLENLPGEQGSMVQALNRCATRLTREIALQRLLFQQTATTYQLQLRQMTAEKILEELETTFARHPSAERKKLKAVMPDGDTTVMTDHTLLMKVLGNMLLNALEAARPGEEVRFGYKRETGKVTFWVWNPGQIPPEIAVRIFQRNFSTKAKIGRGLGTYSMKLFGEEFLKGKISFSTTAAEGTKFSLELPNPLVGGEA